MSKLKPLLIGFILFFLINNLASADDATTNRINGVAQFLLKRANDNYMYILQQDIEDNKLLKCYLPETYKYATSNNLQLLLQSGPDIWKQSVESDLKNFGVQLIFNKIDAKTLQAWANQVNDEYINAMNNVKVRAGGKEYKVTEIPLDATPEIRTAINSFWEDHNVAQSKIRAIIEKAKVPSTPACPSTTYGSIGTVIQDMGEALDSLKRQISRFGDTDVVWSNSGDSLVSPGSNFYSHFMSLVSIDDRLKYYKEQIDMIRHETLVVQMFKLDQLIRESIKSDENPLISTSNMKEYDRFSRYALSFASLSNAQTTDQVTSVMEQLTMPPVSFGVKREPSTNKFMITAYFGVQGGVETVSNDNKDYGGLFVPVGFEYSHGFANWGPISLMLAPLDFAHPINQILNKNEGSAEFKDIFNPGAYLSYGFKKVPLVIGAGYSRGTLLTKDAKSNEGRYMVFIGMDMPLFNLY